MEINLHTSQDTFLQQILEKEKKIQISGPISPFLFTLYTIVFHCCILKLDGAALLVNTNYQILLNLPDRQK